MARPFCAVLALSLSLTACGGPLWADEPTSHRSRSSSRAFAIGGELKGACCTPDNQCVDAFSDVSCASEMGVFLGEDSTCENGCPDCNCDGDSDAVHIFQCTEACVAGGGEYAACALACDSNGDGIPTACQNGSLDPDNDGFIGECDGCPLDPDKSEPGPCGCGEVDIDTDKDGVFDCNDECPNDPDNDIDEDGICGNDDNCPFNFNPDQTDSNGDGRGDLCQDCAFDSDCDDKSKCTTDQCVDGACTNTDVVDCPVYFYCLPETGSCVPGCLTVDDCIDDGNLCTYSEECVDTACKFAKVGCPVGQTCDPSTGTCGICDSDEYCADETFCNGVETCDQETGLCQPGPFPCNDPAFPFCDEKNDECDECVADADCDDDDPCTINTCVDGHCDYPPVDCPQDQSCNPDSGLCEFCFVVPPGQCCNPVDGTLTAIDDGNSCTDDACNPDGSASHTPNSLPPVGMGVAPLAITVTPQPTDSMHPVALMITSPNFPCLSRFLDLGGIIVDEPVFHSPVDWGTITVINQDVVPSANNNPTIYEIRAICDPVDQDTTAPGEAIPYVWGDTNDDLIVDIDDIFCVLDAFQNVYDNCSFNSVNLAQCDPDLIIDISDILAVLDAFIGEPFPCAAPCGGGACCDSGSTRCLQLPEEECDAMGWNYQGDGSDCRVNPCPFDDE